jgi:hypothetical protein
MADKYPIPPTYRSLLLTLNVAYVASGCHPVVWLLI